MPIKKTADLRGSADSLQKARQALLHAEDLEECVWCRAHVKLVREQVESLIELSRMSSVVRDRETWKAMREMAQKAEDLHLMVLLVKLSGCRVVRLLLSALT